jgi:hypothetical protein
LEMYEDIVDMRYVEGGARIGAAPLVDLEELNKLKKKNFSGTNTKTDPSFPPLGYRLGILMGVTSLSSSTSLSLGAARRGKGIEGCVCDECDRGA